MSHVYVVVATRDSEVEVCETFSGVQSALGRAFQLAYNSGKNYHRLFAHDPVEEILPDGSIRWVIMDANKQSVVVFYRKIEDAFNYTKNISRDVVLSDLPFAENQIDTLKEQMYYMPARGSLHGSLGLAPIHDTNNNGKLIDAAEYVKDGLPYGAGGNLAKAILDMNLSEDDLERAIIDITKLPTELIIPSFFNAFFQMISDHDQKLLASAKETGWYANFDFQYANILRWAEDFKPLPPPFDFMDRALPAGWNKGGKPILLGQFLDEPDNARSPLFDLTENEKWALVKARIRKSPHFVIDLSGFVPDRNVALKAVEDQTDFGKKIRDTDIERIDYLRQQLLCLV